MQSAQIHGVCGFFGVLNVGIFGSSPLRSGIAEAVVDTDTTALSQSVFNTFIVQLCGAISLAFWAGLVSYAFFRVLSNMGHLRVGQFYEIVGIDILTHTMSDLIGMDDNFLRDSKKYMNVKKDSLNNQMMDLQNDELYEEELFVSKLK